MTKQFAFFLLVTLINSTLLQSQNLWTESKSNAQGRKEISITAKNSKFYALNLENLQSKINAKNSTINVPLPSGEIIELVLEESGVMSGELKSKYPNIRAYKGKSSDGKYIGRFDLTPKGFHAMFHSPNGTIFIDPINLNTQQEYQVYYKKDFTPFDKGFTSDDMLKSDSKTEFKTTTNSRDANRSSGTELRTYSIAISTTGEYTQFHGGTVPDALAAIVTTMNRVSGIYELEVGISFELVGDTDLLIYTDSSTDPYTNSSASAFIEEVQANIDDILGAGTYDLGHGFSTGAGGLAGPGPCMSGANARGVTGTNSPIGDPYDVDYVAHEIGHQFSANHTFNGTTGSCTGSNRNGSTAYEPGSGTTILAYAGICSPQNIQSNSDPYFHGASYDEILSYSVDGTGNTCPTITPTGNTPPAADAGEGGFIIPANTPFKLTGDGNDVDGDDITFGWEQFDLGPAGEPNSPSENAPLFRSFNPTSDSIRYFPQLSDVIDNTQTVGEILPDYDRSLTFRLTVRDGNGGVNNDQISFDVSTDAGPFTVSSFNTSSSIEANSNVEITWDIANTDSAPVNCQLVNILLSEDGGLTYQHTLASNTNNDGSELALIPNITTSNARIMVEAADNIFFDINDADINVVAPATPDYNISLSENNIVVCPPNEGSIDVNVGSILGYSEVVTLSTNSLEDNLEANFSVNPVTPGNTSALIITNPSLTANGLYQIEVIATDGVTERTTSFQLEIYDGVIETIQLLSPSDDAVDVSLTPLILWTELAGNTIYEIDLATDLDFNNIIESESNITTGSYQLSLLDENSTYFFRVKGTNACEETEYSILSFTTATPVCSALESNDVPINIDSNGPQTITSTITITDVGQISDVNILNLTGEHTYLGDLTVSIESPEGTSVTLFSGICNSQDNFDLSLDDEAALSTISCPATSGDTFVPNEPLSNFIGEEALGDWTLTIEDGFDQDGGSLDSWTLELCVTSSISVNKPTDLLASNNSSNSLTVTWTDNNEDEDQMILERSENGSFVQIASLQPDILSFDDSSLDPDREYSYRIKALRGFAESEYSEVLLTATTPLAPSNLNAVAIELDEVSLEWENNSLTANSLLIERSIGDDSNYIEIDIVNSDETTYNDRNLGVFTEYFYRIQAINIGGSSEYSNESSASTLVLSTDGQINDGIVISPNPFENQLKITFTEDLINYEIIIFDSKGSMMEVPLVNLESELILNFTNFKSGLYFIKLSSESQSSVFKVIKTSYK